MAEGTTNADGTVNQLPLSSDATRVPEICSYFLEGVCRFGNFCRNIHTPVKNEATLSSDRNSAGASGPFQQCSNGIVLQKENSNSCGPNSPNWVNAPEFVPRAFRSYAETVKCNTNILEDPENTPSMELCPYFLDGLCPFEERCSHIHGDICELCGNACMNPFDEKQRNEHTELCERELEQDMELSFAIQRSLDKSCCICMDVIMDKELLSERRFGILDKCSHIFCLSCIRTWRVTNCTEDSNQIVRNTVRRACPTCRVASDFVIPSRYWVETEEEKKKLISEYKAALSRKDCMHFKKGKGFCPFGESCFYLHAYPDGTKVKLPPPVRRQRQNQDGELDNVDEILLWNFLEFREDNMLMQLTADDFVHAADDTSDN